MPSIERFAGAAATVSAGLLAPFAVGGAAAFDSLPWWFWLVVLAGSGFVGGYLGVRASVNPETAELFRGGWRAVAPFAGPPVLLAVGFGVWLTTDLPAAVVWVPFVAGAALVFVGGLLVATTARSLYGTRLTSESETYVELPPERTEAERRKLRRVGAGMAVVVVGVAAAVWYGTGEPPVMLVVVLAPLVSLFSFEEERAAVDAGLRQGVGVEPWRSFAGYRVTDDEIVLERAAWYRADLRIDRTRLDDERALRDVLSAALPERTGRVS